MIDIEWLGPLPESNFSETRFGSPVTLIVDHWMASTFDAALAHFRNPAAKVSAHFLVGRDGRVAQVVAWEDTAYHCGDFVKNTLSIGIEHEASPTMAPTAELYAASARLHRIIADRYLIRLEVGATVLPHRAIVPTACPGTLDLDRIVREAEVMTQDQFNALADEWWKNHAHGPETLEAMKRTYDPIAGEYPGHWHPSRGPRPGPKEL